MISYGVPLISYDLEELELEEDSMTSHLHVHHCRVNQVARVHLAAQSPRCLRLVNTRAGSNRAKNTANN